MAVERIAVESLTWQQARERVQRVNPMLAEIIDDIDPDDSYRLYGMAYPYGTDVLVNGRFYLLNEAGETVELNNIEDSTLKSDLNYNAGTNPLMLVTRNCMELYVTVENRIVPFSVVNQGSLVGIWGLLESGKHENSLGPVDIWDMTAGARSIFLLPKISDVSAFYNLQKNYHISRDVPKNLQDHWFIFKDIAASKNFQNTWDVELLMFSKQWFQHWNDPRWMPLKSFLLAQAWRGGEFFRDKFTWDLTFTRIHTRRGIKPCPYVADIAQHLFALSIGALPAFRPLIDDSVAPVKKLQQVFEDHYKLRYAPVMIGPTYYSAFDDDFPVYYSFNYQTAARLSPKSSKRASALTDMYNINSLLEKYIYEITHSDLKVSDTILYRLAKVMEFNYCHHEQADYFKLNSAAEIVAKDPWFQQALNSTSQNEMPKNAPFLNGCIQIKSKKMS